MKHYNKILLLAVAAGMAVSCADAPFVEYKTEKPESLTKYEYLNEYGALKTYIDRTAHPGFKLGTGITASDFMKQDLVYSLAVSNYDDVTAGNAMKYSSIVADNGNMDFGTVKKFVKTAKEAELSIYGHTLCWHSQQNNKWLNSLIADKEIEVDPDAANNYIKYICGTAGENQWDKQAIYTLPVALEKDIDYTLKADIKASEAAKCAVWPIWDASPNKNQYNQSADVQYLATKDVSPEWVTYEWKFKANFTHDKLQFVFGKHGGDISFDNLVLVKDGTEKNLINNGDFAEASTNGWSNNWQGPSFEIGVEGGSVAIPVTVAEYDFSDGKPLGGWSNSGSPWTLTVEDGACKIVIPDASTNTWDRQLCHETTTPFTNGTTYFLKLKVKGSIAGTIPVGFQDPVHNYAGRGDFTTLNVTTDWKEVTLKGTCNGEDATRLLFTVGGYIGTLYLDDICLYWEKPSNTIPMESEEKVKKLTDELERWIKGMMEACGGYVTAWDVVNEPISGGGNDGNGNYVLQSAVNPDDNGVGGQNFYWQDFLGDDYARIPIKFARKYFEEYGGKSEDLKLFINDYNLESWWDENKKLKSLINWIQRWESDGETKIDGIGTQMHVSYILNEADQKKQEESIVNMFKLLAASGKLVKITELDMGIVEKAFGDAILTENLTDEMQQKMSEFYKFIIQKYFEIIPVAQQYGITHWSPTDSPADSGWRKGQPIGLWDLNYNRKPVYVGFLEGLQNGAKGNSTAK